MKMKDPENQLLMFCTSLEIEVDFIDVTAEVKREKNPD